MSITTEDHVAMNLSGAVFRMNDETGTMTTTGATPVFTIGDLAREFGVTLRTLRFYEDKGLVSPQRDGTTRLYSEQDRQRIALILKGKKLGFTLTEIAGMIGEQGPLSVADLALSREKCLDQITLLEEQRREIGEAIEELTRTAERLASQIAASNRPV